MPDNTKPLTISRLAKLAGIGVETIRYYQRQGLIDEPVKPVSGYRVYPPETLERLRFIQRAKQLGFTLREISELLALDYQQCGETRVLAEKKLALIEKRIHDLRSMQKTLTHLIDCCENSSEQKACPIIFSLMDEV